MNRTCLTCLFLGLTAVMLLAQSNPVLPVHSTASVADSNSAPHADPKAQARILDSYGKLPLAFEANHGQTDGRVKFLSRTSGYTLFLTGDEAVMALGGKKTSPDKARDALTARTLPAGIAEAKAGGVLRMKLRNANPAAKVTGVDELGGRSNYFIGNDSTKWRTNVPTYAKVKYEGIYSGIDLVYYGNQRQLEYDFIVAPGADPRRIAFGVSGAQRIHQDAQGELVFKVGEDEVRWHKPVAYQEKNGERQLVAARYAIADGDRVGFEVAKYDASKPLYIDPLIYSTYLGGSSYDEAYGIAVDSAGNAYITGYTYSTNFPTTPGAFRTVCNGGTGCKTNGDAFVAKINAAGSALVYSTYLGGSGRDYGFGIALDDNGDAYVVGTTYSTDFPTFRPLQSAFGGGSTDAFVAEFNPSGSALLYSTYLGGSGDEYGTGIAADSSGNTYVTGETASADFPTANPLQPTLAGSDDGFVAKIANLGSGLIYSTYLGGSGLDYCIGIAVDSLGDAYVTGATGSVDFPTANALQPAYGGGYDAFVSELNPTGSALVYSTYLGGSGQDQGFGITLDGAGNAYVTGETNSNNFPTVNALQPTYAGGGDAFVSKINSNGSALVYSTYLGGSGGEFGYGISVDSSGNAYVTGATSSSNFPITPNALQTRCKGCAGHHGHAHPFSSKINAAGRRLLFSTFLGGGNVDSGQGIAADDSGNAYVTGFTVSTDFPVVNPLQSHYGGSYDAFVAKVQILTAATTTTLTSSPNPSTYGEPVVFVAAVTSGAGIPPDGETVTFTQNKTVLGTGSLSGGSSTFTTSMLNVGTNSVTAVYGGDANFSGSTSKPVRQVVRNLGTEGGQRH